MITEFILNVCHLCLGQEMGKHLPEKQLSNSWNLALTLFGSVTRTFEVGWQGFPMGTAVYSADLVEDCPQASG